jgi:hypothetical protein
MNNDLPDVQENNEQILNDIQSLQQIEKQLFSGLENNPNLSPDEQKKIIEKMNQLSTMRINLYQTLSGINNFFENALNTSVGSLKEQAVAIGIVENELNKAKARLEILEVERNNKIRLVEINTYFGDKYAEHSQLMKIIIFTLVPIIILAFINSKGFLPNTIYYILLGIISLIGAYFFWTRFASIIMRDNMNYQEYNWSFNPNSVNTDSSSSSSSSDPWTTDINLGTCIGDACCSPGLVYDTNMNQCVPDGSANINRNSRASQESFINNILTKTQPANYKIAYDLRQPKPFNN